MICERCNTETNIVKCSFFNTQTCCLKCIETESRHPKYMEAKEAELAAVKSGDFNFEGIGLPEDLA
jgi:hypothetical protein